MLPSSKVKHGPTGHPPAVRAFRASWARLIFQARMAYCLVLGSTNATCAVCGPAAGILRNARREHFRVRMFLEVIWTTEQKSRPGDNCRGGVFGRALVTVYLEILSLRSPEGSLDDSILCPPLLPRILTKPRTVCACQPV